MPLTKKEAIAELYFSSQVLNRFEFGKFDLSLNKTFKIASTISTRQKRDKVE